MKTKLLSILAIFFPFITVSIGQNFTPAYLEYSDNPYQPMNFYITSATLDGTNLGISDEIGIFDGEICVGSIVLESEISEYVQVLASAQDNDWETIAGFISGNSFILHFWDFIK